MRNVKTTLKGKILTIEIDTSATPVLSASEKSKVIGTTEGNVSVDGLGPEFRLGVNYQTVPKAPKGK